VTNKTSQMQPIIDFNSIVFNPSNHEKLKASGKDRPTIITNGPSLHPKALGAGR
jgi:hypothetical protein